MNPPGPRAPAEYSPGRRGQQQIASGVAEVVARLVKPVFGRIPNQEPAGNLYGGLLPGSHGARGQERPAVLLEIGPMVLVQLHILLPARVGKALRVVHIDHLNAPLPQPQGIPVLPLRCLGQKGPVRLSSTTVSVVFPSGYR